MPDLDLETDLRETTLTRPEKRGVMARGADREGVHNADIEAIAAVDQAPGPLQRRAAPGHHLFARRGDNARDGRSRRVRALDEMTAVPSVRFELTLHGF